LHGTRSLPKIHHKPFGHDPIAGRYLGREHGERSLAYLLALSGPYLGCGPGRRRGARSEERLRQSRLAASELSTPGRLSVSPQAGECQAQTVSL
jgi:hypothetical protein